MTYINREQLLEQLGITELMLRSGNLCVGKPKKKISTNKLLSIVNNLPTADFVPRSEVEKAEQEVAREILIAFSPFRALSPNFSKIYYEFEKKYIGE